MQVPLRMKGLVSKLKELKANLTPSGSVRFITATPDAAVQLFTVFLEENPNYRVTSVKGVWYEGSTNGRYRLEVEYVED